MRRPVLPLSQQANHPSITFIIKESEMLKYLPLAGALLCLFSINAEARQRTVSDRCNIDWPCEGVTASPRGERVVRAMRGFGVAKQVYRPAAVEKRTLQQKRIFEAKSQQAQIVAHPSGCPSRSFCGCGAAVRVFGHSVRELWLAANWFKFPRVAPGVGMVAVRRHHVFVLEADLGGGVWSVYDANSGSHLTRVHARSLAGYVIVNPHGGAG